MSSDQSVANAISEMVQFFQPHCEDQTTLLKLQEIASGRAKWRKAHQLFGRIRDKTLKAIDANDEMKQRQYAFEEICAKTLYNLSGYPAPFDDDSPFWVIPTAVGFARSLGVEDPYSVSSLLKN